MPWQVNYGNPMKDGWDPYDEGKATRMVTRVYGKMTPRVLEMLRMNPGLFVRSDAAVRWVPDAELAKKPKEER